MSQFLETIFVTHPLHGMLVHFPIALSVVTLAFALLALKEGSEAFERAAFYCLVATAGSSVLAAMSGYRDVLVRFEGDAPLVPEKAFLGVTLILLTGALSLARALDEELLWNPRTMVLYLSGMLGAVALTASLGFMGGIILYGW
ncbi:MAG: DUF2231 domain-containing protein [Longimicrobiales bacterium]|nr:DUF2231 domain-containing protein [Longimicrobiales bacterium]